MRMAALLAAPFLITHAATALASSTPDTPQPEASVNKTSFVVFDLETTGMNPSSDRVIELAALRLDGGLVTERKSWLINPGIPVPASSRRIHGISTEMLAGAPAFPRVYAQFIAFLQNSPLIAHNAKFDRKFMIAEISRHGLDAPDVALFDTLRLFKRCFPRRRSYSLENLTRALCPLMLPAESSASSSNAVPRERQFHSALWDAECTSALFLMAVDTLPPSLTLSEFQHYAGKPLDLNPAAPSPQPPSDTAPSPP